MTQTCIHLALPRSAHVSTVFFLFDIYVHVSRVLPQAAGDLSSCSVSDVPFFGFTTLGYGVK